MSKVIRSLVQGFLLFSSTIFFLQDAIAAKLWSTSESYLGSGLFFGPGRFDANQPLFEIELNNLAFTTATEFVTPFFNNGASSPNICGELNFRGEKDGRLSNGMLINENVDICTATMAGTTFLVGVIATGPHQGQQYTVAQSDGNIIMTMDLALDLGVGPSGIIKLPFYGTTGEITIPLSHQTRAGGKGVDLAGGFKSGSKLRGRIGDFNQNGWIDGTLVAVGNLPLDSPFYPGQPYAMQRNFETDIPIHGHLYGIKPSQEAGAGSRK